MSGVTFDLSVNLARLQKDVREAKGIVAAGARDMKEAFETVKGTVEAIIAAEALRRLIESFRSASEAADRLGKSAQQVGLAVERYQELAFAFRLGGVEGDQFNAAMGKLADKVSDAASGNKDAVALFKQLGVSIKDSRGQVRDLADILPEVADAFARGGDGIGKSATAADLFGAKAGRALIPTLNEGAEGFRKLAADAHAFGAVLDAETIKAAERFNDNLETLAAKSKYGILRLFIADAAELTEKMVDLVRLGVDPVSAGVMASQQNFKDYASTLQTVNAINAELLDKQSKLARFQDANKGGSYAADVKLLSTDVRNLSDALTVALGKLAEFDQKSMQAYLSARSALNQAEGSMGGYKGAGGVQPMKPPPKEQPKTEGQSFIEQLQKQVAQVERGKEAMLRLEATQKGVATAAEPWIQRLEAADALTRRLDATMQRVAASEAATKQAGAYGSSLAAQYGAIVDATDALTKQREEVERLTLARKLDDEFARASLGLTGDELDQVVKDYQRWKGEILSAYDAQISKSREWSTGWQQAFNDYANSASDAASQARTVFEDATKGMEDALVSFAMTGKLSFRSLTDSILADLLRIAIRSQMVQMMKGSGASGWLSGLGSLFGGRGGSTPSSMVGDAGYAASIGLATGGPFRAGEPVLVGEQGPEIATFGASGQITPTSALGGSTIVYSPTIRIDGALDQSRTVALIDGALRQNARALQDSMRRRGAFSGG